MHKRIDFIFFDIGGVLIHLRPERVFHRLTRCTGLPRSILEEALFGEVKDAYETGKLTDDGFFRSFNEKLPQPNGLTRSDFFKAWEKFLGDPTATLDLARRLAEEYPVWLASNTNSYHIRHGESKGYFNGFAGSIYSFEVGARKPSKEFFDTALKISGATPHLSLFIDDREENIEAALSLGFKAIHYRSHVKLAGQAGGLL